MLQNLSDAVYFPRGKVLTDLTVGVQKLSNDGLLLVNTKLLKQGDQFQVNKTQGYSDGQLSVNESVNVPFSVCLKSKRPFTLRVDVYGNAH